MNSADIRIVSLLPDIDRMAFDCGVPSMNDYLQKYAGQNEENHLARTRIAIDDASNRVAGYYTTSFAQVSFEQIPVRGLPRNIHLPLVFWRKSREIKTIKDKVWEN